MLSCVKYAILHKICDEEVMITSKQCKAGRTVLNWTQSDLSAESGVSVRALQEFEADQRTPNITTLKGIISALERNGIVFIEDGAGLYWGGLRGIHIDPRLIGKGSELE